ncbi:inactive tyrosine-protein kinase 7-like [Antedon mediterranea]|uniref:inactive tyrosine-protein kinase 7-like n=1 Tax=Antedon mediterranea TaxID=105859 RepID=UPI003AF8FAFA
MACWNYNPMSFSGMLFVFVYLSVYLHMSTALSFTSQPAGLDVKQGEQASFQCVVDDPENAIVTWTLDNVLIEDTSRRFVDGEYLRIIEVQRNADDGEFVCVAEDKVTGTTIESTPVTLNIKWISESGRVLLKGPADISEVAEGVKVTLLCKIDGNPLPTLTWYRDGKPLVLGTNYENNGSRLKIKNMSPDDNGEYSCRGMNRIGDVWSVLENITLNIEDTRKARVDIGPMDVTVVRGETAEFDCSCSGDPEPTIAWYFQEFDEDMPKPDPLSSNSRQTILQNGSLHIDQVKRTQGGTYICTCSNERSSESQEALLTVANIDNMQNFDEVFVKTGSPLSVNCTFPDNQAGGVPIPEPVWASSDGSPLSTVGNVKQIDSFLIIDRITDSDYGMYQCTMSNIAGQKQASVDVQMPTKPKIIRKPRAQVVKEDSDLYSHCEAEGMPTPTITWFTNNVDVMETDKSDRTTVFANGTLHISKMKLSDSSFYMCKAMSSGGFAQALVNITVQSTLKFTHWQKWKQMEVGDPNRLTCSVRGATDIQILWQREGGNLPENVRQDMNTLFFDNPKQSDSGNYKCTAMSMLGEIINNTINVSVMIQPKFSILPGNITGYLGRKLIVHCQASGDPEPKITWLDIPKDAMTYPNGTVIFPRISQSDEGVYQCVAGSRAGLNTTFLNISVSRTPPPVEGLMTRTIAIAVGCAVGYIFLVVGLMCYCRHRRLKMSKEDEDKEKTNGMLPNHEPKESNGQVVKDGAMVMNPVYPGRRASYDNLLFPKHDLQKLSVLGKGKFGEVFLARAVGIKDGEEVTTVIVKSLTEKEESIQLAFRKELDMLSKVDHDNIVKLLGMCREGDIQFMITEYLDWGDLKNYLIATKGKNGHTNSPPQLTLTQKIDVINQIAQGMEHLANNRFTHGDLAAHNCLLSPSMEIKITTISVSEDLFRSDYHEYNQQLLPIRWMAPEAIYENHFSPKSDVWSFGVVIWEVFSAGELPYKEKDNESVLKAIVDGDLMLETPQGTPEEVEILMHRCWSNSPADRPSFGEIVSTIGELPTDSQI